MKMSTSDLYRHFEEVLCVALGEHARGLFLSVTENTCNHIPEIGEERVPTSRLAAVVLFPKNTRQHGNHQFRCEGAADATLIDAFEADVLPKLRDEFAISVVPEFDPIFAGM